MKILKKIYDYFNPPMSDGWVTAYLLLTDGKVRKGFALIKDDYVLLTYGRHLDMYLASNDGTVDPKVGFIIKWWKG